MSKSKLPTVEEFMNRNKETTVSESRINKEFYIITGDRNGEKLFYKKWSSASKSGRPKWIDDISTYSFYDSKKVAQNTVDKLVKEQEFKKEYGSTDIVDNIRIIATKIDINL